MGHLRGIGIFDLLMEIHVALCLERYEMDVGVGNFESEYRLAYLSAGDGFLNGFCHSLGEYLKACEGLVVKIEDVVGLLLRDYERMAPLQWIESRAECRVLQSLPSK